jgi:hypothetical protein
MADYLQRLIDRANGASDARPSITPFIRQQTVDDTGGNENPFESAPQPEAPTGTTSAPVINESQARAKGPLVEEHVSKQNETLPVSPVEVSWVPARSVPASGQLRPRQAAEEAASSPRTRKHMDSGVQTEPVVHQKREYDAVTAQPAIKTAQYDTQSPLSSITTREENSASSSRQSSPELNRLPSKQDSFPREELVSHSPTLSKAPLKMEAVGQAEISRSQARQDRVTATKKLASSPPVKSSGMIVRSEDKNTADLRPRNITASSNPRPSREQPSLVIGRLQVDVVAPQTEAPPPRQVHVSSRAKRPQQKRGVRISSKLRFGVGQL